MFFTQIEGLTRQKVLYDHAQKSSEAKCEFGLSGQIKLYWFPTATWTCLLPWQKQPFRLRFTPLSGGKNNLLHVETEKPFLEWWVFTAELFHQVCHRLAETQFQVFKFLYRNINLETRSNCLYSGSKQNRTGTNLCHMKYIIKILDFSICFRQ